VRRRENELRITGIAGRCARAASGQAAAVLARRVIIRAVSCRPPQEPQDHAQLITSSNLVGCYNNKDSEVPTAAKPDF
jgi:hypothetical protein